MGKNIHGFGNNGKDGMEGAIYRNAFGRYPRAAAKNPWFTDYLILTALRRRYGDSLQSGPNRRYIGESGSRSRR